MGKKITIDSATLMNKVSEVIEAKNIFDINQDKISILIHPKSYVHAIIKFKNGLSKFLIHEPDMTIPIYNSVYFEKNKDIFFKYNPRKSPKKVSKKFIKESPFKVLKNLNLNQ